MRKEGGISKKKLLGIIACIIGVIVIIIATSNEPTPLYTLTTSISPSGSGSVSPSGGRYESGAQVTLMAVPATNYKFDYWSGNASGTAPNVSIAVVSNMSVTANFKTISAVSVYYEVTASNGTGYLSVRMEGPQNSYSITLLDPKGESVGYGFVSSDDMITNHKTVAVSMTGTGVTNPVPGEYQLTVRESLTDRTVFEARPVFGGPAVSITKVGFVTDCHKYLPSYIWGVHVDVHNSGDLPVVADEMRLLAAGREADYVIYEPLPHGKTKLFALWDFFFLDCGTHPITVEIYSEGMKLASYATEVTIK